jgi:hypothetical protein
MVVVPPHRVEDRGVGVMLKGFNITYLAAETEFEPWGQCLSTSLWIHHFQKAHELMHRRYAREVRGESICGPGFPSDQVCALAEQGKPLVLACPSPRKIVEVVFATYGRQNYSNPGPCSEGPDALVADPSCHHAASRQLVEAACLGKARCDSLVNTVKDLGGIDPCPGEHWSKRFLAVVRCA